MELFKPAVATAWAAMDFNDENELDVEVCYKLDKKKYIMLTVLFLEIQNAAFLKWHVSYCSSYNR